MSLRKINQAIKRMYATLSMDYALRLALPALMQCRGLQHLTVRTMFRFCARGSGMVTVMKMSAEQLREKDLDTEVVGPLDPDRYCRFSEDPNSWSIYPQLS